jgi:hypothetical protein
LLPAAAVVLLLLLLAAASLDCSGHINTALLLQLTKVRVLPWLLLLQLRFATVLCSANEDEVK